MSKEVTYDTTDQVDVIKGHPAEEVVSPSANGQTGTAGACVSEELKNANLANSENAEILEKYAADYPVGPHDKPQSMCPAFGSLRVGLRMRRVATVLSGSACCVYGLSFVSHFYGARRSVGYVPFDSESLVTGKLFEDIRDSVHDLADPDQYDAIVVTNLCVPTASGVPLRLLPNEINGVRIIGIDVPGFGVPTHAEAKDILAGAMLNFARQEVEAGPVQAPKGGKQDRPTVAMLGEMFPADPMMIGAMLAPMGLGAGPVLPAREWREMYAALDCGAVAAIHPFYTSTIREFDAAGRPSIGSAPVGYDGTADWLAAIGDTFNVGADKIAAAQNAFLPAIKGALSQTKSTDASLFRVTKAANYWSHVCSSKAGQKFHMSERPARKHQCPKQMQNGSHQRARLLSSAHRLRMICPLSKRSNQILQSERRRLCKRSKKKANLRFISPILFLRAH